MEYLVGTLTERRTPRGHRRHRRVFLLSQPKPHQSRDLDTWSCDSFRRSKRLAKRPVGISITSVFLQFALAPCAERSSDEHSVSSALVGGLDRSSALFAQGSGAFAAVIALCVSACGSSLGWMYCSVNDVSAASSGPFRRNDWRVGIGLLGVLAIVVLGWILRVNAPQHASMHAHSITEFAAVLARSLASPWVNSNWVWLITQAPIFWFAGNAFLRRRPPDALKQLALGLALLAGLHAAAVAYSRGAGLPDGRPLSR